jgi:hypothetical protein
LWRLPPLPPASKSGGVRGHTAFAATAAITDIDVVDMPLQAFADCFRTKATFLPFSTFDKSSDRFVCRLKAEDLWLKKLIVTSTASGIRRLCGRRRRCLVGGGAARL